MLSRGTTQSRLKLFLQQIDETLPRQEETKKRVLKELDMILHDAPEDFGFLLTMIAEDPDCQNVRSPRFYTALTDYSVIALSVCERRA